MRAQLNALKGLIDAVLSGAVIDEVTLLPHGSPPTATVSLAGGVLHLSFGIPEGASGAQGEQGAQGGPGEVTNAALAEAIANTARNPVGLPALDGPYADPNAESLRQYCVLLTAALFRSPT